MVEENKLAPTAEKPAGSWLRRAAMGLAVLLIVGAVGSALAALWLYGEMQRPHQGFEGEKLLIIARGSSVEGIARQLQREGVVASAFLFRLHARLVDPGRPLQAGQYKFDSPISIAEAVEKLRSGDVFFHRVTVPEGLDRREIAEVFVRAGFGTEEEWAEATEDPTLIRELDTEAIDLEGYLFPETYFLTYQSRPEEIVEMMVGRFRRAWTSERRQRASELGLSVRETVTLASLIEKETGLRPERNLVSSVFHNRLRRGMLLQCDPTVVYAVKQVQEFDGTIRRSHLQMDSPYNTYVHPGLPPGPIANPGEASIEAALFPAASDFLFFVSRNDGSHHFSVDYAAHSTAVRRYQRNR